MSKKTNTASDPSLSSGTASARSRKHAPAKRPNKPALESSPSTDITAPAVKAAALAPSNSVETEGPAFDEIARLAYSYWEARGCQGGSPEEDWLRAEQHLRSPLTASVEA